MGMESESINSNSHTHTPHTHTHTHTDTHAHTHSHTHSHRSSRTNGIFHFQDRAAGDSGGCCVVNFTGRREEMAANISCMSRNPSGVSVTILWVCLEN